MVSAGFVTESSSVVANCIIAQLQERTAFLIVKITDCRGQRLVAQHFLRETAFVVQHLRNAFFKRATANELVDVDVSFLADAISTICRLIFDGGIPPTIKVNNVGRSRKVQANSTHFLRRNEDR